MWTTEEETESEVTCTCMGGDTYLYRRDGYELVLAWPPVGNAQLPDGSYTPDEVHCDNAAEWLAQEEWI